MIKITTDSTCDLPQDLINKFNIPKIPLYIIFGETTYEDGIDIQSDDIYDYVEKTKELPKTAARSAYDYVEFFKPFVEEGQTVIHIGLSSELSSSFRNAQLASEEFEKGKVFVVDSKSLCCGVGLLVLSAIEKTQQGKTAKEIIAEISLEVEKQQTSFVVDKLDYLHKGGRVSRFSFSIGSMMKIKPRLQMIDGKIINTGKDMGPLKGVLKKYIDATLQKFPSIDKKRCFIVGTKMNDEMFDEMVEYLESKNIFKEVIRAKAGCTITSHCGENTFGIMYICE